MTTKRPTHLQAEILALLRQGWLIRRQGYFVTPSGMPTGDVPRVTLRALRARGWLQWTSEGWTASETAP